jgi:hypothetical protein
MPTSLPGHPSGVATRRRRTGRPIRPAALLDMCILVHPERLRRLNWTALRRMCSARLPVSACLAPWIGSVGARLPRPPAPAWSCAATLGLAPLIPSIMGPSQQLHYVIAMTVSNLARAIGTTTRAELPEK